MALVSAFGLSRFSVFGVTDFDINHDKIEVIFGFCWLERFQGFVRWRWALGWAHGIVRPRAKSAGRADKLKLGDKLSG